MNIMKKISYFLLVVVFIFIFTKLGRATVSSCSGESQIHQVRTNASTSVGFSISNTSSSVINWVKITRPSTNFTVTGGSSSGGWTINSDSSSVTYTGKTLGVGGAQYFEVSMTTGSSEAEALSWIVQTADDGSGGSSATCTGNTLVSITSGTPDNNPPIVVSDPDFTVTDITATEATISWETDEAARYEIKYGVTTSYGSTSSSGTYATSQEATLTSLSANTGYHYQVEIFDAAGNSNVYGDYTFTTAVLSATPSPVTIIQIAATPTPAATPSPQIITVEIEFVDKQTPQIQIRTDLSRFYTTAPNITGVVSDNKKGSLVNIEYSIDGGKNWLPVDDFGNPGGQQSEFSFLPEIVDDGNYKILVRSKDAGDNVGISEEKTLVIDRLEPRIGGGFMTLGPLSLPHDASGRVTTLVGFDHQMILGAVGGATTIDLETKDQQFSLVKNPDNGLWKGTLSFQKPGEFKLLGRAVDGANNKTERELGAIMVLPKGQVKSGGQPESRATISVFVFDTLSQAFTLWDGVSLGQVNPQTVEPDGEYTLELPAGRYYIEVAAPKVKKLKTTIFDLSQTTPINMPFSLEKKRGIQVGSWYIDWFDFGVSLKTVSPEKINRRSNFSLSVDQTKELPPIVVSGVLDDLSLTTLRGRPTILTVLTTWSPQTSQQLTNLVQVDTQLVNVVTVFTQQNISTAAVFMKRGQYDLPVYADFDGELVAPLNIYTFPTHFFIDRTGQIKDARAGLLTAEEIVDILVE